MQQPIQENVWLVNEPAVMDSDRYLSSANAPDLKEDARLCIASGTRQMILNCANMTYMTGSGVRTFLEIARLMEQAGGVLRVHGLSGQPREIFLACGMDTVIPMVDDKPALSAVTAH